MKKVNTGASVKARLLRIAKASGKPYDGMLKLFAMERLAYRLSKSRFKDVLILKGALFFLVMNMPDRRTTLDIDLLARYDNDPFKIAGIVKEICSAAVENDGIIYDTRSITSGRITEAAEYPGVRVKLNAYIEKTRVPLQVDFGFGDAVYPGVKKIKYPVLLDLPAPKIKCYPRESA